MKPIALAGALCTASLSLAARAQDVPPPSPTAPPPPNPYGAMQAGGLAPPPPMPDAPAEVRAPADDQAAQAKKKDSGRGLEWVWLDAEAGFEHVGLQTFTANSQKLSAGFVPSVASGGVLGAGLGLRLVFLTLGARGRVGFFGPWQLFSVGGEVGVHLPLGSIEPHVEAGFGYAALGNLGQTLHGDPSGISIRGFYGRLGGGLDYYVTPFFSIGGNVSLELLGLTRPGLDPATISNLQSTADLSSAQAAALAAEGSSYGGALAVTGVLGLHF